MTDDLRPRLEAVERAITDGETDLSALGDAATLDARLTAVEERLATLETRLAELDAATQAVRGYLSGVDGVTDDVERQAALALAKAERVERAVLEADDGLAVERLPASADESALEDVLSDDPSADGPGATERQASSPSVVSRLRDAL